MQGLQNNSPFGSAALPGLGSTFLSIFSSDPYSNLTKTEQKMLSPVLFCFGRNHRRKLQTPVAKGPPPGLLTPEGHAEAGTVLLHLGPVSTGWNWLCRDIFLVTGRGKMVFGSHCGSQQPRAASPCPTVGQSSGLTDSCSLPFDLFR